ncbi:rho GTPase-activating protein Graf [Sabethes cyaneus]|uniref:rho GTPase-activating protein Graf n=1 Tax=Sabethes cyaneus TaxID=53552 RepID=UPI00237D99BA|nr:rho GTPase-activating protein Graf [Sabethes cyaneus]XP_053683200.1 rho GTPase-activating protein Graf [Sabethes cyaneus]XP_053683201.1 rho GTPase-activating protein Graf [Sabethes cyaneus]XP_053683202.1 rho GTPase-activating protein Graf [Sabethes cyaneus]XP_053683203.1 rho GTPase-activating protein Graf [Sabethes cyaneus]XP_053683204.1 rho GTPase-activating protein Graf [Sabethes cyaneus]XP_053683205.1 rho GTPase-activating protein Graf [Sabethes cyaneus]
MVIGKLQPLEFTDCLLDSPEFRENLNQHEKELEKTSQQIKRIIKEVKDLLAAAKNLSRAQRTLSKSLNEFNFECIGSTQTDDEQVIADSLKQFGKLISAIEEERDNMLDRAHDQIVGPLEEFRKCHIGGVKENKKKYDKKTAKFCQAQERFLNMSSKKPGAAVVEADASLGMLEREYLQESLSYVLGIQEVQERIKFEFVEIILRFISDWLVFYHLGHEVAEDARDYLSDLQLKVQKTRENFDETRQKAQELKHRYMESKMKPESEYAKQGYLFVMEKKAFTATWSKYYCTYKKQSKKFSMLQFNQMSGRSQSSTEVLTLASCTRRLSEFEKRYCFDLIFEERPAITYTCQALSEEDRKAWLNAMDGKEPAYLAPSTNHNEDGNLDDVGFAFVRKCIEVLERRGLEEEGLYRIGGVSTKITKLLNMGLDRKKTEKDRLMFFNDEQSSDVLESKTIASALKHYLRNLNEPLMTFRLHHSFISAAKQETRQQRINDVHQLIHRLPKSHFEMLDIVIRHLKCVSLKSEKNKMSVFNLGVVFGPTLLRAAEETVAAILDIKFNNVVIEILIENYDKIFKSQPGKNVEYLPHTNTSPLMAMPRSYTGIGGGGGGIGGGGGGSGGGGGNGGVVGTGYTKERNVTYSQPVVRVVAKSNYTEPVMSSSLQNISNGLSLYSKGTNHYPTYEAKPKIISSINSSTPSLLRDTTLSPREISIDTRETTYLKSAPSTITISSHNSPPPPNHNHHLVRPDGSGGSSQLYQSNYQSHLLHSRGDPASMIRGGSAGSDSIYGATTTMHKLGHPNPMTSSDSNLTNTRKELSIYDRINSTSSSNESVCSSSSRDLNHSYGSSRPISSWDYGTGNGSIGMVSSTLSKFSIRDDTSQGYIPKKTQRVKGLTRHTKMLTPRDNLRVRTLYACLAENDGELSFEPNQIITNVKRSNEPGWLEGTLNGKSGLIPENYVEVLK